MSVSALIFDFVRGPVVDPDFVVMRMIVGVGRIRNIDRCDFLLCGGGSQVDSEGKCGGPNGNETLVEVVRCVDDERVGELGIAGGDNFGGAGGGG